jgi:hypothetical protein
MPRKSSVSIVFAPTRRSTAASSFGMFGVTGGAASIAGDGRAAAAARALATLTGRSL